MTEMRGGRTLRDGGRRQAPCAIAFFIDELRLGGTEKQLVEMVRRLNPRRFSPMLFLLRGELPSWAGDIPCPWQNLRVSSLGSARAVAALVRAARILARSRVRIVQTVFFDATVFGVIAARIARVQRVVCLHRDMGFWYTPRLVFWLRRIARLADRHATNARAIAERIRVVLGIAPERIAVLPNGMDLDPFLSPPPRERARACLGLDPSAPIVGLLANLNRPVKRPDLFVEGAALVAVRFREARFAILGDGPLRPGLEEQAKRLGLSDRLFFLGQRPSAVEFAAAVDVGVCSSDSEGLSNAILELQAGGVPMVATRTGGNPELVREGETGLLFPPGDARGLADGVTRLLGDPALARQLGARARAEVAARFGWDATVTAMEGFYASLL